MKYLAYALVSFTIGLVVAFFVINSGFLQSYIQKEARAKTGIQVVLGPIQLAPKWPLTLTIGASQIPAPNVSLEFKSAQVAIASFSAPYDIRAIITEPKVKLNGPLSAFSTAPQGQGAAGSAASDGKGSSAGKFRLALHIINGEFRSTDLGVTALNFEFEQKLWMSPKAPAKIKASARVETQYLPGSWPISVQSDGLVFGDDAVKAQSVKATFAGLLASVQGTSLLSQGRHRWLAEVKAPDLAALPQPPLEIPASHWQGAIEVRAEIIKDGKEAQWQASGNATAQGVKAKIKWQKDKLSVDGPAALEMKGKFAYKDQKFTLPELEGSLDLGSAQVLAGEILSKPNNVPLRVDASLAGAGDKIEVKKLEARFWNFLAKISGSVGTQAPYPGVLAIDLPSTSLKGLETIILPLKKSLVQGEAALQAEYTGSLTDPLGSLILIKRMALKNFSADISYEGEGSMKARGPFSASVEAVGQIDKSVPKNFQGSGFLQLGGLALVAGPLRKEPKQALSANFNLRTEGEALQIEQMVVKGFLGEIRVNGKVSDTPRANVTDPRKPRLNLIVETKPLDLSELRVAMPEFRDVVPKGSIVGRLNLNGEMDFAKTWAHWPVVVGGEVKVNLPEYVVASAPAAAAAPGAPSAAVSADVSGAPPAPVSVAPPSSGFLPKGALTEKLNVQIAAEIGTLVKDKLTVKGVGAAGRILAGRYKGSLQLREIFGGKMMFSGLDVPLFEPLPMIQGNLALENVIVQDALDFVKPEYKAMATGRAKGALNFSTLLPSDARFMDELKSKGQIVLEPITLSTIRLGEILNELIGKVPALKLPPAKLDPLKGVVRMDYSLSAQTMTMAPLVAVEENASELELKGKVVIASMQGDLVGNFMWANSGIKGCLLEGNADAKGRLVLPIALKGNLLKPQFSMVTDTSNKLAGRALECEKRKFIDKVKADGGESLKKEGEKLLKGILGK